MDWLPDEQRAQLHAVERGKFGPLVQQNERWTRRGLVVREVGAAHGIPDALRIPIGSEPAIRGGAGILQSWVTGGRAPISRNLR